MNELDMQKYIVDSVNHAGGFAYKMSHRFLIGVVDVMVKLPDLKVMPSHLSGKFAAGVLEVKQRDKPKSNIEFTLDVTPQQKRFLRQARDAGMPAGVASFLQVRGKGVKGLELAIYTLTDIERLDYHVSASAHSSVATEAQIMEQLRMWHRDCSK